MDALTVSVSVQAALSRVADVMAVADRGIAGPTKSKERASLMAKPFRFSLHPFGQLVVLFGLAEHRCRKCVD